MIKHVPFFSNSIFCVQELLKPSDKNCFFFLLHTVRTILNLKIIINYFYRFEDGTVPFLSILAIKHGFDTINRLNLNFDIISQHTFSLAQYVYRNLSVMHHFNAKPAVILYHDTIFENREHQGGIINFNLLRPNGDFIGYSEVRMSIILKKNLFL